MQAYLDLLAKILSDGEVKADRTGTGTRSLFGYQMRFALHQGFPLITTKKLHWKSIVHELLWFLRGDTNIAYLKAHGVGIWDEWADENGDLGPVYGKQWRAWQAPDGRVIDQIATVVEEIKRNPLKRLSPVRRWLTYMTLFLSSATLLGDTTTLIYNLLGGDLTIRFVLKVVVVAAIAGTAFAYYLLDLRTEERE